MSVEGMQRRVMDGTYAPGAEKGISLGMYSDANGPARTRVSRG